MTAYLDTSALAKWYLNEPGSESFSEWIQTRQDTHVSSLTALELRSLLARRKRMKELSAAMEQRVFATFLDDVAQGHLIRHTVSERHFLSALDLLDRLSPIALRTLDALHLGIAQALDIECLATADKVMAEGGLALGFEIFQPQ